MSADVNTDINTNTSCGHNLPLGFALCHGWSFEASAMLPLQTALRARLPGAVCANFDLGFGAQPHTPSLDPARRWIAVGHSWGFAWLVQQPLSWHAAVALNGFSRFCRRGGQAEGTPVRLLDAMLARLASDPVATVRDFHHRCGADDALPQQLDPDRLRDHLLQLRELDMALPAYPLLALTTSSDLIVSPALAQACFGQSHASWRETGGNHIDLLHQADVLADWIVEWVESLHD